MPILKKTLVRKGNKMSATHFIVAMRASRPLIFITDTNQGEGKVISIQFSFQEFFH